MSTSPAEGTAGWLEVVVLVAATALVAAGLAGLGLAMFSAWSLAGVLGLGAPTWLVMLAAMRATLIARWRAPTSGPQHLGAALALVLGVTFVGWYGYQPSQHLLVERDPGAYVTTAMWVAEQGSLRDAGVTDAFADAPGLVYGSPGSYLTDDGLEFQFNHLTAVVGALASEIGGHRGLFRVTGWVAVLGLLAAYAVASRVTRRPLLSLIVPATLGASLPVVVLARDMYSEPYLLAVLWSSLLMLDECWRRPSRGLAAVAGVLSGALLAIRVESLLYLTALFALAAFTWFHGGDDRRRVVGPFLVGVVPPAALGLYDFVARTGGYTEVIGSEVRTAAVLLVVVSVGAVAVLWGWRRADGVRRWVQDHRNVLGVVAASFSAALLAGLWLIRPLLPPDRLDVERWGILGAIQLREGDAVDPFRSYYELSVRWIEWYVGPFVLIAGIAGIALMVRRLVLGDLGPGAIVALAVFSTGGLAYLLAPGINPDQLWATRRLVPVALVTVVLAAVWVVGAMMDRMGPRPAAVASLGVVASLVFVVPTARATAPIALVSEQPAMWGAIGSVCDDIGADGAVAVVGVPARDLLPMALRARCDVPVAELETADVGAAVEHGAQLEAVLGRQGRTLTLVAMDPADLMPFEEAGLGVAHRSATTTNPREHEHTLNGPPRRYLQGDEIFFLPRRIAIWTLQVEAQ